MKTRFIRAGKSSGEAGRRDAVRIMHLSEAMTLIVIPELAMCCTAEPPQATSFGISNRGRLLNSVYFLPISLRIFRRP